MIFISDYVRFLISAMQREGRFSAAESYNTVLNRFCEFRRGSRTKFSSLNARCIKDFERFLYAGGCGRNTVSLYMRLFRSICRQASAAGYMKYSDALFSSVFMGHDPCCKRAVSADSISALADLDLSGKTGLSFSRDLFLLSFYLRGIPFIDLAHLRKSDVRDGVVHYRRSKTGQSLSVRLETWAREILDRYKDAIPGSPYLLPVIKRPGEEDEYKQYQSALRLYNKRLNQLSRMLGLEKNLTSYVARHSWATLAYHEGIPVSEISAGLSHTSEQVTYAYLESFSTDALAGVNLQVVALVNPLARKCWESDVNRLRREKQKSFRFLKGRGTNMPQRNS